MYHFITNLVFELCWFLVEGETNHVWMVLLQEEIHELLLSFAEVGANVVRLKGGDPLVSFCL